MRTIKTWLATIAVLLCSISARAQGDFYDQASGLSFKITSRTELTVEVASDLSVKPATLIIPKNVTYDGKTYLVTSIGSGALSSEHSIVSVSIPESVIEIKDNAFYGCNSLSSVSIHENSNLTSIGVEAFCRCKSLVSITIPKSVTEIKEDAFRGCSSLTSITIPNGVNSIENSVFSGCSGLTSVTIPNNVRSIGDNSFGGCSGITSITMPDSLTNIGIHAFYGCSGLTSITIPKGVTTIGSGVFWGCASLKSTTIHEGVTEIGVKAFCDCTGELIVNCNIPEKGFFESKFSSVTIGDGVTSIGGEAFRDCVSITSVTIGDGVTSIGGGAFAGCVSITSVTIGDGVTSIGGGAFARCSGLTSVTIPENVKSIATPFLDCNIKKIFWKCSTLPEGFYSYQYEDAINYTANSDYASYTGFKVYPMLGNMFEVDGVTYVPTSISERTCDVVDYDCKRKAISVNVGPNVVYKNVSFTVKNVNDYTFYGNQYLEDVTITNQGITGSYTFANCPKLNSVQLAEGVTSIGEYAFNACEELSSFVLPASVTSIGKALFNGCNGLATISVADGSIMYDSRDNCNAIIETTSNRLVSGCNQTVIVESVEAIADYAFSGCGEMKSVNIHENIKSIGDYAFIGCYSLSDVVIEDRIEVLNLGSNGDNALFSDCPLDSVYVGGIISYNTGSRYGYSPFSKNTTLRTVVITDMEETVYPYEFYNCSALKRISIGDKVTSIGDYALSGCTSLEEFIFGCSMETIGNKAFLGCSNIKKMVSKAVNPPVCGANALDDIDKWNCVLSIPNGSQTKYHTSDQWKEFLLMEDTISIKRYALTYIVNGEIYHTDSLAYRETILLPEVPIIEGHTFIAWEGLPQAMPITDVTVNALFSVNEYTLLYIVDDEEYNKESVAYGTSLEPQAAPTKEGHTFSGWSEIPETMPAEDVTITGSFVVNNYKLTYIIDGVVFNSESVAYGSPITMLEAPLKTGYEFDGWDKTLNVMPAEDVEINGSYTRLPLENFIIRDGENSEFFIEENLQCDVITYTRTLSKTNTWNALYVPFEIPMTAEFCQNYDVAYFNDVHCYDNYVGEKENGVLGQDGVIDGMDMEVLKAQEGSVLNANYPYLIRAKNTDALNMNIKVEDATLYSAKETTISCSSVFMKFDVTGIYTTQTAGELKGEYDVYAISGGGWKQALNANQQLKPFRLYLKLTSIDGSPVKATEGAMSRINIRVQGEDTETGIDELKGENGNVKTEIFDLSGRRVQKAQKGIFIQNGKKVIM